MGTRCADHMTPLYPQKLALTSPTGGGRSVGIVRSRTKATEFSLVFSTLCHNRTVPCYRARWLREIGFVGREYKRWYHQKPKCADNSQGFVSVRIQDFYPALVVLAYGIVLSVVILILEIADSKLQRRCRK